MEVKAIQGIYRDNIISNMNLQHLIILHKTKKELNIIIVLPLESSKNMDRHILFSFYHNGSSYAVYSFIPKYSVESLPISLIKYFRFKGTLIFYIHLDYGITKIRPTSWLKTAKINLTKQIKHTYSVNKNYNERRKKNTGKRRKNTQIAPNW